MESRAHTQDAPFNSWAAVYTIEIDNNLKTKKNLIENLKTTNTTMQYLAKHVDWKYMIIIFIAINFIVVFFESLDYSLGTVRFEQKQPKLEDSF